MSPIEALRRERARGVRRTLRIMLAVSLLLAVAKTAVGVRSGSLAVLGGAIDSGVDVLTTLVSLLLAAVAAQGPDERHPYGHAKFDAIGALAIVAFLSITVFELIRGALGRLIAPEAPPVETGLALWVMAGALGVGWIASEYERRRGRALGSDVLLADAAHLRADVWVTLAVLVGLLLARLGLDRADAWATILVALLIAHAGWRIITDTVPVLVDERAVDEGAIREVALGCAGVREIYHVRSRGRAGEIFAEMTISVDGWLDVDRGHRIADAVEAAVARELGAREVMVHVEPRMEEGERR